MKNTFIVIFILLLLYPLNTNAVEADSLFIGGMDIKIGMKKNEVLSKLKEKNYQVTLTQGSNDKLMEKWLISEDPKMATSVGSVTFQNNKVSSVARDWRRFYGAEAISIGRELVGVISKLVEGGNDVRVFVNDIKEPGISAEVIILMSGRHCILITVDSKGIQISESIL